MTRARVVSKRAADDTSREHKALIRAHKILTGETTRGLSTPALIVNEWIVSSEVQAIGIAKKIVNGRRKSELAIAVYVAEKKASDSVDVPIPPQIKIAGIARPVPTDVMEIGRVEFQTMPRRPALPGWGISRVGGETGTLGCVVRKKNGDGKEYILTNAHVIAGIGAHVNDPILQPGSDHGGQENDCVIGVLSEWVDPDYSTAGYPNLVDAAIAEVVDQSAVDEYIALLGRPRGTSDRIWTGMAVKKSGYSSHLTRSLVRDTNCATVFTYRLGNQTYRVGFRGLIMCDRFTSGGDSGSVVVNSQGEITGLHIGGSDKASFFCRIAFVFGMMQLTL